MKNAFVFCERYYPESFNRKESYKLNELYNVFACRNIFAAKVYFQSVHSRIDFSVIRDFLKKVVSYWGHEFYIGEENYSYIFGGWVSPKLYSTRLDFYLDDIGRNQLRAFKANIPLIKPISKKDRRNLEDKPYLSYFDVKYGFHELPDEMKPLLPLGRSKLDMLRTSLLYKNDAYMDKVLSLTSRERVRQFNLNYGDLIISDIYEECLQRYSFTDFLPPKNMISEEEFSYTQDCTEFRQPRVPNPLLSALTWCLGTKVSNSNVPFLESTVGKSMITRGLTTEQRRTYCREVYSRGSFMVPPYYQFYIRGRFKEKSNIYYNEQSVISAYASITGRKQAPRYRSSLKRFALPRSDEDIKIFDILCSKYQKHYTKMVSKWGWEKIKDYEIEDVVGFLDMILKDAPKYVEVTPEDIKVDIDIDQGIDEYVIFLDKEREILAGEGKYGIANLDEWIKDDYPVYSSGLTADMAESIMRQESVLLMCLMQTDYKASVDTRGPEEELFSPFDIIILTKLGYIRKLVGGVNAFVRPPEPEDDIGESTEFTLFD